MRRRGWRSGSRYRVWDHVYRRGSRGGSTASAPEGGKDPSGPGSGGGPVVDEGCGKATVYEDDFDAPELAPVWQVGDETLTFVNSGQLVILPPDGGGTTYLGLFAGFNFTATSLTVDVIDPGGGTSTMMEAALEMYQPGSPGRIRVARQQNNLVLLVEDASGAPLFDQAVPYEPDQQKRWRLGERSGEISLETSPGNEDWTLQLKAPTPGYADAVQLEFSAATNITSPGGVGVRLDNLNVGRRSSWCPVETLSDDFDQDRLQTLWWHSFYSDLCTVEVTGGEARVQIEQGQSAACWIESSFAYDFDGSVYEVEFKRIDEIPGATVWFGATGAADFYEFGATFTEGDSNYIAPPDNSIVTDVPYDAEALWWRLRGEGTELHFEISQDGDDWQLVQTQSNADLHALRPYFGLEGFGIADTMDLRANGIN